VVFVVRGDLDRIEFGLADLHPGWYSWVEDRAGRVSAVTPPTPKPPSGETALRWSMVAAVVATVLLVVIVVIPCAAYAGWFLIDDWTSTTH
jgi:hypothetical protein